MNTNYKYFFGGMLVLILAEFFVYKINHKYHLFYPFFKTTESYRSKEMRGDAGRFTNPLIECLDSNYEDAPNQFNISKEELQNLVDGLIKKDHLQTMSVYIRDLNNGPWIGINEQESFIGGSLLKVPILIAYLKLADEDSSILDKEIEYKNKIENNTQYFSPSKELEIGKKYSVNELLHYMIKYSDNNAAYLLYINLNKSDFDAAFSALGLGDPDPDAPYIVNSVSYAGFFRVLFNVSYLSKKNSERALNILTETEFDRGLSSGVPRNIQIAHKFGIRSDGSVNQLHDCGIVYYPKHPYLLCVMTKGGSFDDMAKSIGEVSSFVYKEVNANHD